MTTWRKKTKKTRYNSIQIWYEGTAEAKLELDVNIWRIKNVFRKIYMDFGLRIKDGEKIEKIFIYFPFVIQKTEIIDLGSQFSDAYMLTGVFNENYIAQVDNKNIIVMDAKTKKQIFSIYQFDVEEDLTLDNIYEGVILSWEVKPYDIKDRYFRFRIQPRKYGTLIGHYRPKNSFFESAFVETELLDFRINEKRNQDMTLIEKISANQQFTIENINFFLTTPIQDEVASDGTNLVYKRQLESGDFWKNYLGQSYERMSVYKYNNSFDTEERVESFSIFSKIKYRKSNFLTIVSYLLVLCLITVIFNTISNCVWHYMEPKEWRIEQDEGNELSGTE